MKLGRVLYYYAEVETIRNNKIKSVVGVRFAPFENHSARNNNPGIMNE